VKGSDCAHIACLSTLARSQVFVHCRQQELTQLRDILWIVFARCSAEGNIARCPVALLLDAREALLREVEAEHQRANTSTDVAQLRQLLLRQWTNTLESVQESKDNQYVRQSDPFTRCLC
jgi:hypothetical protein